MSTDENQIEELQKIYEVGMTEMGIPLVDPRIEKISQRLKAATEASVIYIKASLDNLSDEDAQTVAPLFDELKAGMSVKAGDVYSWDGTLIEVLQAHTRKMTGHQPRRQLCTGYFEHQTWLSGFRT